MNYASIDLCLQTNSGLPEFKDYRGVERIIVRQQAIIHTYRFNCCGNITEWGADVKDDRDRQYTLNFQVWRPSPTVDQSNGTGDYSLVGNNRFTSISLNGDLVRVSPSPQDRIQFQPGDVLGLYVESADDSDDGVVILPSMSERVWYGSIAPSMATSQTAVLVGSSGAVNILTNAAPVISIDMCKCMHSFLNFLDSKFYSLHSNLSLSSITASCNYK